MSSQLERAAGPEFGGAEDGEGFEADEVVPECDPGIEGFAGWRFHELEAAGAGGVQPAGEVGDVFRQHAALELEALGDGLGGAGAEVLDDHEEQGGSPSKKMR